MDEAREVIISHDVIWDEKSFVYPPKVVRLLHPSYYSHPPALVPFLHYLLCQLYVLHLGHLLHPMTSLAAPRRGQCQRYHPKEFCEVPPWFLIGLLHPYASSPDPESDHSSDEESDDPIAMNAIADMEQAPLSWDS
ncbi:hypothetical protein M408DRAFT_24017 [Serendipita vermifera MAFF 305830]|uniref:Uncharacterized protein n=1 Tax=Serendipita vermifera MAFF 305830 TaxID=933852 RepID=A0A0C3ATS9_SERVB|nr:hypothetical protein M408DRAFT_24017 [Serendipita vermifera MAFF 305830]